MTTPAGLSDAECDAFINNARTVIPNQSMQEDTRSAIRAAYAAGAAAAQGEKQNVVPTKEK